MIPPEILYTERLILRIPRLSDAAAIFHLYAQDTEVTRHVVWRPHTNVQETEQYLTQCVAAWGINSHFSWVIALREDGQLLGMIELRINNFKADIGYVVARPFWGRGIATEAGRSVVEWALLQEGIYRVWALCDTENVASARVLEKVGMGREGLLRRNILHPNVSNEPRDSYCYAIVK
ncbi:MAG TPA: GNAT family N-acetyltransferase [Pyrinomonadaceae bacterium]|jgi:RimJ/RimL family protein N-acetyltransferase